MAAQDIDPALHRRYSFAEDANQRGTAVLRAICILILAGFAAVSAQAQDDIDMFTISGVKIDASGETATEARQAAIAEGSAKAMRKLFERLTLREDHGSLPGVAPSTATSLATGFQIDNELRSPTRYRGLLTVSFDPVGVSQYLRNRGIAFVESAAPPTLVLPVLDAGGRARLWEANPWGEAWDEDRYAATFTPVMLADGFDTDNDILTAQKARDLDTDAIRALARLYNVERVLVAVARPDQGNARVDLNFIRTEPEFEEIERLREEKLRRQEPSFDDDLMDEPGTGDMDQDGEESAFGDDFEPVVTPLDPVRVNRDEGDNILEIAADRSQIQLAELWKQTAIVRAKQKTEVQLTVMYRNISEWLELRSAIGASPFIADARLDGISRDGALMTVTYRGLREQLMGDLHKRGARMQSSQELGEVVHALTWRPFEDERFGEDDDGMMDNRRDDRFGDTSGQREERFDRGL